MPAVLLSIFTLLIAFIVCFCVLFHSYCSPSQVLWMALVWEFHIFRCRAEWSLLSSRCDCCWQFLRRSAVMLNWTEAECCYAELDWGGVLLCWTGLRRSAVMLNWTEAECCYAELDWATDYCTYYYTLYKLNTISILILCISWSVTYLFNFCSRVSFWLVLVWIYYCYIFMLVHVSYRCGSIVVRLVTVV